MNFLRQAFGTLRRGAERVIQIGRSAVEALFGTQEPVVQREPQNVAQRVQQLSQIDRWNRVRDNVSTRTYRVSDIRSIDYRTYEIGEEYGLTEAMGFIAHIRPDIEQWANGRPVRIQFEGDRENYVFAGFGTTTYTDIAQAYRDIEREYRRFLEQYKDDASRLVLRIVFGAYNTTEAVGQGAVRSITRAMEKWYEMSSNSITNCLYHTIASWNMLLDGHDVAFVENNRASRARYMKNHMNDYNYITHKQYSNEDDIQRISNYYQIVIRLYNNLYEEKKVFTPQHPRVLRKDKPELHIRLAGGHFSLLFQRHLIKESNKIPLYNPEEVEDDISVPKSKRICRLKKDPQLYNYRYASYDIETSMDEHGIQKSYAIGMAWWEDDVKQYKSWWGNDCIREFFDYLHERMDFFNGYTMYAHNGAKFDMVVLLHEHLLNTPKFQLVTDKCVELNGGWIGVVLRDQEERMLYFKDSIRMMPVGLAKLAKEMRVEHQKLTETVKHHEITLGNWHTFDALPKYLENDCLSLLEVLDVFSKDVYDETQLNITSCYTGASLAKKVFFSKYYDSNRRPIWTLDDDTDDYIRSGYFGGRVECFHLGEVKKPLYYLDFTSLYPDVGRNHLPFNKPEKWDGSELDVNGVLNPKFFGFVRVRVRTINKDKLPLHGLKKDGKLLFPHFDTPTEMVLFSEEVRLGMKLGLYEYEFLDGIGFMKYCFMKTFFEDGFTKKAEAKKNNKPGLAQAWKIIINSGYGFWGLRTKNRDSVLFLEKDEEGVIDAYMEKRKVKSIGKMGDYITMRVEKNLEIKDFNVAVASAISSYARMKLYSLIYAIREKGFEVYYCDTDSIITDCKLNDYEDLMSEFMPDGCGDALGSLKNEADEKVIGKIGIEQYKHLIARERGMISFDSLVLNGCKFYALRKTLTDGKEICISKAKGYKEYYDEENDVRYELTYDDQLDISDGGFKEQKQLQFRMPKSRMCDEDKVEAFGIKINKIDKKFKKIYDKGSVMGDGSIVPVAL